MEYSSRVFAFQMSFPILKFDTIIAPSIWTIYFSKLARLFVIRHILLLVAETTTIAVELAILHPVDAVELVSVDFTPHRLKGTPGKLALNDPVFTRILVIFDISKFCLY